MNQIENKEKLYLYTTIPILSKKISFRMLQYRLALWYSFVKT